MTYFETMLSLLKGRCIPDPLSNLTRLQYYCIINVLIFGLIYGSSAIYLSSVHLITEPQGITLGIKVKILMAGASIAFLLHAGASLFFWVFFKAVGGALPFNILYFQIGQASISMWPLAPFLAAFQAGLRHPVLSVITLFLSGYALMIYFKQVSAISKLTRLKLGIAFAVAFIYISCFLYLWV